MSNQSLGEERYQEEDEIRRAAIERAEETWRKRLWQDFGRGWRGIAEQFQPHQAPAGDGQALCNGEPEQEELLFSPPGDQGGEGKKDSTLEVGA